MSIVFEYPTTSPTHTATLPSPQLGNGEVQDIKTKFRRAMDGTMHSFISTPALRILTLSFTGVKRSQYMDLINLLLASSGSEVKYTDYDSVVWEGRIINDPAEFTADGPLDSENQASSVDCVEAYSFSLQFEGTVA